MNVRQMPLRLRSYLIKSKNNEKPRKKKQFRNVSSLPADNKITFIIPSIGRTTLINSVNSIKKQTIKYHETIIVFDGIKPTLNDIGDDRFRMIEIEKKGWKNCAADVRHEGIKLANTKWVAFLDDDDTISENYIEKFYKELGMHPDVDVIIFRMIGHRRDGYQIIPNLHTMELAHTNVGISFVLKKEVYMRYKFEPSTKEDFDMLYKLQKHGHKMVISPYITYFVKGNEEGKHNLGNRLLIN